MKLLALSCALLILVRSESETVEVEIVNYAAMYNNECPTTTTAPAPGPAADDAVLDVDASTDSDNNGYENGFPDIDMSDNTDSDGGGYASKYDHYYKKYENKYEGESDQGSVRGNENGGDASGSNPEQQQSSTFCKCLAEIKKSGKSYDSSQNDFSKCIDKANGNDAGHWEKVAQKYARKYGIKTDSWELPQITTTIQPKELVDIVPIAADNNDDDIAAADDDNDVVDDDDDDDDDAEDADNADDVEKTEDADVLNVKPVSDNGNDGHFGNAAVYITFIGTSVMLFICAWFIKNGFKKWKMREYKNVGQCSESEQDADNDGNIYSDWDDNYDYDINHKKNNKKNKGKFGWDQYSSV